MDEGSELLVSRRDYARCRLDEIASRIDELEELQDLANLCIYVTGSFGRLEASEHSDLDLFFIHEGASDTPISRIKKTLLDACLIRAARELEFPEFSNDGQYLSVHYLEDIMNALGGREDDFDNHFTARLLLLLESKPIHNTDVYNHAIQQIIQSYYRDYHDHETSFRPIFLMNDIIRFWRTLCLNYEHRRNRTGDDEDRRNRSHLVNLKLKFSRLLTCHSAIALLSVNSGVLNQEDLLDVVRLSPLQRLEKIATCVPETDECISAMKMDYSWFLEKTGREKLNVLSWIADRENRNDAFERGRQFATNMYKMLCKVTDGSDTMRFLVV